MTEQQHPITPPPELLQHWYSMIPKLELGDLKAWIMLIKQIYAAGADQELEACIEVIADHGWFANPVHRMAELRAARRPKPPSLKEINLKHLDVMERDGHYLPEILQDLRRAVEQLDD